MRLMAKYTYVSTDIKENELSITIATCRNISGNTQTISLVTITSNYRKTGVNGL